MMREKAGAGIELERGGIPAWIGLPLAPNLRKGAALSSASLCLDPGDGLYALAPRSSSVPGNLAKDGPVFSGLSRGDRGCQPRSRFRMLREAFAGRPVHQRAMV